MNTFSSHRSTSIAFIVYASIIAVLFISSCASPKTSLNLGITEVSPGVMAGYLEFKQLPNSVVLLPAPPGEGSTAFLLDTEISKNYLEKIDTAAWKQAQIDAELYFPEALESFSNAIAFTISEEETPNLYILLRRILGDASFSTYAAKKQYMRPRPFMMNNEPTCTPEIEEHLKDGSYPSGHAAIGWAWALVLTEIFPERVNHIIERGRAFGQSRVICNVHWQSDVDEGRFIGAATVARLHSDPVFLADLEAAKKEVISLRE